MTFKKLSLLLSMLLSFSFLSGCEKYKTCAHKWIRIEEEATCTEDGFNGYECTKCGERQSAGEAEKAHGHSFVTHSHKDPTCQQAGEVEKICQYCGEIQIEELAILEHDYVLIEDKSVTCTEDGYKLYECSFCHERVKTDVVEATGHKFEHVTISPTCTEDGYTCDKCSVCGLEENKVNFVDKKGHHYIETVVAPTCTEQGYTIYQCEDCDDHYVDNIIEPLNHDFDEVEHIVSPTCIQEGYSYHECKRCHEESEHYNITSKVDHQFEAYHSESDCTHTGESYQKCSVCGKVVDYHFEQAKGHSYYEEVHPATCTEDGYTLVKCHNCDYVEKTDIKPAFGHDFKKIVVEANCQHDGYSYDKCTRCGEESEHYDVVFDRPHHLEEITVLPTCDSYGYTVIKCHDCDYIKEYTSVTEPLGHLLYISKQGKEPSCHEKGYTNEMTCKVCGKVVIPSQEIDYHHHYSKIGEKEPSCVESGYEIYKCDLCGETTNMNYTTLGYHHVDKDGNKRCDDCNARLIYEASDMAKSYFNYSGNYVLMNDMTYDADEPLGLTDKDGLLNHWDTYSSYGTAFTGSLTSNIEEGYTLKINTLHYDAEVPYSSQIGALFFINKGNIHNINLQLENSSINYTATYSSASDYSKTFRSAGLALFNEGTIEKVNVSGKSSFNNFIDLTYSKDHEASFTSDIECAGLVHTNTNAGTITNCKLVHELNYESKFNIRNLVKADGVMATFRTTNILSNNYSFTYAPVAILNKGTIINTDSVMICNVKTKDNQIVEDTTKVWTGSFVEGGYGLTSNTILLDINSFVKTDKGFIFNCYCNKINTHNWKHEYNYTNVSYRESERYSHSLTVVGNYLYDVEDEGTMIDLIEV